MRAFVDRQRRRGHRKTGPNDARAHGIRGFRSSNLSPRQPPCWQQGEPPLSKGVGLMPGTVGRSPGSRVVVPKMHRRILLAFPEVDAARKGGRFVDDRGVRPRLIAQPSSGFSGSGLSLDRPHHANRHPSSRPMPDGRPSPLYSRGVGCDWRSRSGSPPSHSLLLPEPKIAGPETIRNLWNRCKPYPSQSNA